MIFEIQNCLNNTVEFPTTFLPGSLLILIAYNITKNITNNGYLLKATNIDYENDNYNFYFDTCDETYFINKKFDRYFKYLKNPISENVIEPLKKLKIQVINSNSSSFYFKFIIKKPRKSFFEFFS